jgi:hypothetical protein
MAAGRLGCVVLLASVSAAQAGEGVLIENIPAKVDKAGALAAAKDALKYREWRVVGEDADSVSAKISRSNIDASIRIKAVGSRLVYVESATGGSRRPDYSGKTVWSVNSTPSRWIEYLRSDITERLTARAETAHKAEASAVTDAAPAPSAAPAPPPSAAPASVPSSLHRLQELKDMLDRGLITADEYARKKDEILKAL